MSGFGSLCWQGEGSRHRSPFFLGSYCEEWLGGEGGAGSHLSRGRADHEPKGVAGAGREDRLDCTVGNEPKSIKDKQLCSSSHGVPLQKDPGSCSDIETAKDRTEMSFHLLQ